jgi:hypothetical protein
MLGGKVPYRPGALDVQIFDLDTRCGARLAVDGNANVVSTWGPDGKSCVGAICACHACVSHSVWSSHTADQEAVARGDAPTHRWGHSACLVGSSDLVIFGGFDHECNMYAWSIIFTTPHQVLPF